MLLLCLPVGGLGESKGIRGGYTFVERIIFVVIESTVFKSDKIKEKHKIGDEEKQKSPYTNG